MRWDDLDRETCSLSRTLAVIGDRWTLLVLRDAFYACGGSRIFRQALALRGAC